MNSFTIFSPGRLLHRTSDYGHFDCKILHVHIINIRGKKSLVFILVICILHLIKHFIWNIKIFKLKRKEPTGTSAASPIWRI
jgi:hypothetical protein